MSHDEWLDRADFYALGALDGEELARFEDHLELGCAECDRQILETREALLQIPLSLPQIETPSPDVKRRLMAQLESEATGFRSRSVRARYRPNWSRIVVAASIASLVCVLGVTAWDARSLRSQLREVNAEASRLRTQLVQRKEVIAYLEDPNVAVVSLAGLPPSPGATGRILWRPADRSGFLLARGLPETPAGKKYAVWAIAANGPTLGGLFTAEESHRAHFRLPAQAAPPQGPFRRFAVTLEPASGGPSPTGPMHLQGGLEVASLSRAKSTRPELMPREREVTLKIPFRSGPSRMDAKLRGARRFAPSGHGTVHRPPSRNALLEDDSGARGGAVARRPRSDSSVTVRRSRGPATPGGFP
jgi:anti-sigma-K factor RskA